MEETSEEESEEQARLVTCLREAVTMEAARLKWKVRLNFEDKFLFAGGWRRLVSVRRRWNVVNLWERRARSWRLSCALVRLKILLEEVENKRGFACHNGGGSDFRSQVALGKKGINWIENGTVRGPFTDIHSNIHHNYILITQNRKLHFLWPCAWNYVSTSCDTLF